MGTIVKDFAVPQNKQQFFSDNLIVKKPNSAINKSFKDVVNELLGKNDLHIIYQNR